ncbi:MAG: hypothetical protein DRQ46_10210 [Gammaproteobacteria bacterium]|nr:MAG: hypothetical protein DRQ46_10210 [Gammaproteobacteria bacterium]
MTDSDEELMLIGEIVVDHAENLFIHACVHTDFCIQEVGNVVVFGGVNRLIWHPKHGFYCDKKYCTQNFMESMKEMMVKSI